MLFHKASQSLSLLVILIHLYVAESTANNANGLTQYPPNSVIVSFLQSFESETNKQITTTNKAFSYIPYRGVGFALQSDFLKKTTHMRLKAEINNLRMWLHMGDWIF